MRSTQGSLWAVASWSVGMIILWMGILSPTSNGVTYWGGMVVGGVLAVSGLVADRSWKRSDRVEKP